MAGVLKGMLNAPALNNVVSLGILRLAGISYMTFFEGCVVRTNHTQGIHTVYSPTNNFCEFRRTFTPVPGVSGRSVRYSYPYPELLEVPYASATHTRGTVRVYQFYYVCEFCTPEANYPEVLWSQ